MADNVDWAVQQLGPGTRAVLWSHNGHINRQASGAGRVAMGHWLAARHGPAYLAVGFAFGAGGFQAVPVDDNGSPGWLQPFDLPRPAPEACETALLASGLPNAILNLRNLDLTRTGARWFHEPHPLREVGDRYPAREAFTPGAAVLASRFDLLVFLRTVTPSRPLERRQGPQTFRERF